MGSLKSKNVPLLTDKTFVSGALLKETPTCFGNANVSN